MSHTNIAKQWTEIKKRNNIAHSQDGVRMGGPEEEQLWQRTRKLRILY